MSNAKAQTLFVGGGNMARAILTGYKRDGGDMSVISIIDPFVTRDDLAGLAIGQLYRSHDDIPVGTKFSTVVLATKPQVFEEASRPIASVLGNDPIAISIMAGVSSARIAEAIGQGVTVVRCMPNMAAAVQKSVNVAYAVPAAAKLRFEELFKGSGPVMWLAREEDIHATTAVSGSGPAYFFAFVEAMAQAGKTAGLEAQFALDLAMDTMIGAAELLKHDREPAKLRESVTSKGGTTAAALDAFAKENALGETVLNAVLAAQKRSREF